MNYFIFQGPIEEKGLNGLQKAFNVNNSNIYRQVHTLPPEVVRSENQANENQKHVIEISEVPDSKVFAQKEIQEESKRFYYLIVL